MGNPSRNEKLAYLDAALEHVEQFRFAVDAGAHVGYWSSVMAQRFESIMCFEPMPDNAKKWHRHMQGVTNATLVQKALGERSSIVRMDGKGHSKHYAVEDSAGDTEMVTLDSFNLSVLDFLKVDCEGADTLVLRGSEKTLRRCRPVVIVESFDRFNTRYGLKPGAQLDFLKDIGAVQVAQMFCDHIFVFPRA